MHGAGDVQIAPGYEPSTVNGIPVPVILTVDVTVQ